MELYTIFRGNHRFMEGEYSEKQKKINANFNETYDLVVESLFGHQNSIRAPCIMAASRRRQSPALRCAVDVAMAIRPPFLFGESLIDASARVQGVRSAARRKTA